MLVKDVTASVAELAARREGGALVLDGELEYAVTYVGTDAAVRRRDGRVAFRRAVETGEVGEGNAIVSVRVRVVDFELRRFAGRAYGDTLDYRAQVQVFPAEPVPPARPGSRASCPARYSPLQVEELVAEQGADALEEREVALDLAAFKVIDLQTSVAEAVGEVLAGTVLVEGALFQKIYYVAEDGLIHYQHAEFPFQKMVEVAGAGPGLQVQVTVRVRSVEYDLSGDGRRLAEKLQLALQVKAARLVELEAMTDLMAPPGIEVRRDLVRVDRVVGRGQGRSRESGMIRLPAPGGRLVKVAAVIEDLQSQVLHGQVLVEGTVREQVFFTTGGTAYHQEEEVPFTCVLDVPGAEPGMLARAQARVEEVAPDPGAEGPEVAQEVVVAVTVRVTEGRALEVVTALDGPGLTVERRRLTVERLVGQGAAQLMLQKKAVLVSRALGIVRVVGSIQDLICEVIPDQVIVQGRFHQQVLFIDRHKVERHQTEDVPFSQLVEVPGALPGMAADVEARVKHLSHSLLPEGGGFAEKAVIDLAVWVVERAELSVVTGVAGGPAAGTASGPGDLVALSGMVPLPRPYAERVGEVRTAVCPSGALRVHVFFVAPNRLVYHTCRDFSLAGGMPLGVREFRWTPVAGSRGLCEGVRWEAVLACSASRST